jgi:predicted transcriptional regulator
MKEFSKFEIATIKRTAQNVAPLVRRKNKIKEKIDELYAELQQLETQQTQWEQAIVTMTGGFTTEDLVDKVVETTNSVDKDGNPVKVTKYVLKYLNTVVPVPTTEVPVQEEVKKSEDMHYVEPATACPIITEAVNWNN